jgi:hypothetical protein
MEVAKKKLLCPCLEPNPHSPVIQPAACSQQENRTSVSLLSLPSPNNSMEESLFRGAICYQVFREFGDLHLTRNPVAIPCPELGVFRYVHGLIYISKQILHT